MKRTNLALLMMPVAAVACAEPQNQSLPFELEPTAVTRSVPASGGIITSPAGASVVFPAGAFAAEQSVTLTPGALPPGINRSGRAISSQGFVLEAPGARLGAPSDAELAIGPSGDSTWLASLVSVSPAGVSEYGNTRVDVASGIASAPIDALGTLAVVIPRADAVFSLDTEPVEPSSPTQDAAPRLLADSLRVECGTPLDRCEGLSISASDNLIARARRAAVLFPALEGTLRVRNGEVVGSVAVSAALRAELAAGQIAENVLVEESFHFRVPVTSDETSPAFARTGAAATGESAALHIPESGRPTATVRHELQIPDGSGGMEPATITITFPFEVHQ